MIHLEIMQAKRSRIFSDSNDKKESRCTKSLKLKKKAAPEKTPSSRFGNVSNDEISAMSKGYVPLNTEKNTNWALRVFQEWKSARNKSVALEGNGDICPDDLLDNPHVVLLNFWIPRFIAEVCNKKGQLKL